MFDGNRLRNLRKAKGLSQDELAKMIGVSKSLISCYENDKRTPSLDNIICFINIFGVSSDYLLGNDNLIKVIDNSNSVTYKSVTNEEIIFIEELKKDKLVYNILLEDPKRGAELIKKKIG